MDKKKKIIATVAFMGFMTLMGVFLKIMVFSSDKGEKQEARLNILTPSVDENKIKRTSKIQNYEREKSMLSENKTVKSLGNVEKAKKEYLEEEEIINGVEDTLVEAKKTQRNPFDRNTYKVPAKTTHRQQNTRTAIEEDDIDEELKQIMELQNQLIAASNPEGNVGDENLDNFINSYNQYAAAYNEEGIVKPDLVNDAAGGLTPKELTEISQKASERIANSVKDKIGGKAYFQGAGSARRNNDIVGLVPAETVDQGVLVNGSTIAIRTKKEVSLKNPALYIPKGSIVYGKVNLSVDRLLIDINSYKTRDKLYLLDFSLYDYDGREGIHLGNRTWPKIPSKVAKDVYDYAYQRGTQAAAFGGNNSISLDEAKDIATLSAAKEISEEVFDKRRVYMPKKYHLWFNINEQ